MESINVMTDSALNILADYIVDFAPAKEESYKAATLCLADALGCAILALKTPACTRLLGPICPGISMKNGIRIPGIDDPLDPLTAAFSLGTMIRWLDYNDTWLGLEWGHPSDNLGGLLSVACYLDNCKRPFRMRELLACMIKAYEIQGILSLGNSFNIHGFDHVIFVKVATAGIAAMMMGASKTEIINALSQCWIDLAPLRTYRHAPNTGSRKSWAAGDATRRGVEFAFLSLKGEMGYPKALSAKNWGFYDILFEGKSLVFKRCLDSYIIEHILFKVLFPAEFHAQTAAECAILAHTKVKDKIDAIEEVRIETQESAMRIINKTGPLENPAARDHCLQYIVAVGLIYGYLDLNVYEDSFAKDSRIDALRQKMTVTENPRFSQDYLDQAKHSIANSLHIRFKDGTEISPICIEYPLGHWNRREEALPFLWQKFENNLNTRLSPDKVKKMLELFQHPDALYEMRAQELLSNF